MADMTDRQTDRQADGKKNREMKENTCTVNVKRVLPTSTGIESESLSVLPTNGSLTTVRRLMKKQ
jgi:hypothetical protein